MKTEIEPSSHQAQRSKAMRQLGDNEQQLSVYGDVSLSILKDAKAGKFATIDALISQTYKTNSAKTNALLIRQDFDKNKPVLFIRATFAIPQKQNNNSILNFHF